MITKVYIVDRVEHLDSKPTSYGVSVALSESEVNFLKSNWEEPQWGRYCKVLEVKRDLRFLLRNEAIGEVVDE